ncbi:unnamed protein product, partial [Scytosiphon promiscuus]
IQPPYQRGSVHPGANTPPHRRSSGLSRYQSKGHLVGLFRLSFPPILGHLPAATTRAPGAQGLFNTLAEVQDESEVLGTSRLRFCANGCGG